jgi:hypothetical protein
MMKPTKKSRPKGTPEVFFTLPPPPEVTRVMMHRETDAFHALDEPFFIKAVS